MTIPPWTIPFCLVTEMRKLVQHADERIRRLDWLSAEDPTVLLQAGNVIQRWNDWLDRCDAGTSPIDWRWPLNRDPDYAPMLGGPEFILNIILRATAMGLNTYEEMRDTW